MVHYELEPRSGTLDDAAVDGAFLSAPCENFLLLPTLSSSEKVKVRDERRATCSWLVGWG